VFRRQFETVAEHCTRRNQRTWSQPWSAAQQTC
jgi:hypothetical protein